jgi:hypothetical protein
MEVGEVKTSKESLTFMGTYSQQRYAKVFFIVNLTFH